MLKSSLIFCALPQLHLQVFQSMKGVSQRQQSQPIKYLQIIQKSDVLEANHYHFKHLEFFSFP